MAQIHFSRRALTSRGRCSTRCAQFAFEPLEPRLVLASSFTCDENGFLLLHGTPLAGDIDQSSRVDFTDFLVLASNFGRGEEVVQRSDGDLDGDGKVGFSDFLILAANFGAEELQWQGPPDQVGHWSVGENWNTPATQTFFRFKIDNGGTAEMASESAAGDIGIVGENGNGHFVQTGGLLHLGGCGQGGHGELTLGFSPGSLGTFQLSGGELTVKSLQVGQLGEGLFTMTGGTLEGTVRVGNSTDATGTVHHVGGRIVDSRRVADSQKSLEIGRGHFGQGHYQLSGTGQIQLGSLHVDHGSFVQSGGSAVYREVFLGGAEGKPSLVEIAPGDHAFSVRNLFLNGLTEAATTFRQDGATVQSRFTSMTHGVYELNGGQLQGESFSVGGSRTLHDPPSVHAVVRQSGGTIEMSDEFYVGSDQDFLGNTIVGRYELYDGTLRASRIRVSGGWSTVEFHQAGGRTVTGELALGSTVERNGLARLRLEGGELLVRNRLTAGTNNDHVEFDFGGKAAVLETGESAFVQLGPNVRFVGAENATLRLGPNTVLNIPSTLDLTSVFGTVEGNGVIDVDENGIVHVAVGDRLQVGTSSRRSFPGFVVDGTAYVDPGEGTTEIRGQLQVNPGGIADLGDFSEVTIVKHVDAGVFGGRATVGRLMIGDGSGEAGEFSVEQRGSLQVADAVAINGRQGSRATLNMARGTLTADKLSVVGRRAEFRQLDGRVEIGRFTLGRDDLRPADGVGQGTAHLTNGTLITSELNVDRLARFEQLGGLHRTGRLVLGDGTYRMNGGSLIVESSIELYGDNHQLDLSNAAITVTVNGAILHLGHDNPLRNTTNATFAIDQESLVILPAGVDVQRLAGSVQNQGLVHHFGETLTVPAGRTVRGQGNLGDSAPKVEISGALFAARGGAPVRLHEVAIPSDVPVYRMTGVGIRLHEFLVHEGAQVDLGSAYVTAGPAIHSQIHGGTMRAFGLQFERGEPGTFQQNGGQTTFDVVVMNQDSTYALSGGELNILREVRRGNIDFAGSSATLRLGDAAFIDLEQTSLTATENASLIGGEHSLIIVPPGYDPASHFASFSTAGIVHQRGSLLTIAADQTVAGDPHVDDGVSNGGTIDLGFADSPVGRLVIQGSFQQLSSGRLIVDVAHKPPTDQLEPMGSDHVSVRDDVLLDGTLEVRLPDDFTPLSTFSYTIVSSGSAIQGRFANATETVSVPGRGTFDVAYGERTVELTNFRASE